ncbi:MAG: hypothetical protein Q7U74_00760, partial [Saprospiraceae bacterium]|nr:hypothetical protein [Saprospiraceae bacterium]
MKKTFTTTRLVRSTCALLFALFFAGSLFGQATLSVQGVLKKSDGTAVEDKTHNVTFALYKSQGGNDKVWDGIIETETRGGIFNVVLGAPPGPALTAPFDVIYYLGVRVEGGQELQPRPQLTHAPYAMGLIGQNNVFPSTGTVKADGIVVPGGAPNTGVAGKGYSFGTGGDQDGGLFSTGSDNVGLYANATKALEASPSGVTIPGTLSVGNTTVNGNETVTGSS